MMMGAQKNLEISGLDFPLAVASSAAASEHIGLSTEALNKSCCVSCTKDAELWKKSFKETIDQNEIKQKCLIFQCAAPENMAQLKTHLRKGNLFLLPSKFDSPTVGTEALAAVAAGVPILVSRYSGIASLLGKIAEDEPVVDDKDGGSEVESWKRRIVKKIVNPVES